MFTVIKSGVVLLAAALLLPAQEVALDPYASIRFNLPNNSPISMLSASYGDSRATARGGALVLDLHMSVSLRNQDSRRIRAIMMLVTAHDAAPGGRASYSVPTLDVGPGESFPVKIDVRLVRPLQAGAGPWVQVSLDGVLFEGLDFYGPNKLNSRRTLTFWEMENQRDRAYLKQVLSSQGQAGLQKEMLQNIARQGERLGMDVQVSRNGRATGNAAIPDHVTQFALLNLPEAPVQAVSGWAEVAGNEAHDARIKIQNSSRKSVKYVEIGWIVKDRDGHEFLAGSMPLSEQDLYLPAGTHGELLQESALRFSRAPGQPFSIQGMTGFVSQVEYSDGQAWVPSRQALQSSQLMKLMPPSTEEQRLTDLYRKKGMPALLQDLNRH